MAVHEEPPPSDVVARARALLLSMLVSVTDAHLRVEVIGSALLYAADDVDVVDVVIVAGLSSRTELNGKRELFAEIKRFRAKIEAEPSTIT